ncbi:hypothetical protein [Ensifer sp.]|uniref:hypothetical protein n=1 Tax=Ensifer sp. TaxID=1872086 RepID=UPI00289A92AD|nr:hypothetical protein [Ensifer sp.]
MQEVAVEEERRLAVDESIRRARAISVELRKVARKARTPRPTISGGGGFRARKGDRLFRLFAVGSLVLLFVVPTAVVAFYYSIVASDQYVSEARFSIRSADSSGSSPMAGLSALLGSGQATDAAIVAEYVKSGAIINQLTDSFSLTDLFTTKRWDPISSLAANPTSEDLIKYWKGKVDISVERSSGLTTLRVRAFSAEDSLRLTDEILRISELMVNRLTRRTEDNGLREAEAEVHTTKDRLTNSILKLKAMRDSTGILDVTLAAAANTEVLTKLRLEKAKLDVQIQSLEENDSGSAPQLGSLKNQATAIGQQIAVYEQSIAGGDTDSSIASRGAELSEAETDLKVAQTEYQKAVAVFEAARMTTERQRSYILTHVQPTLPEEALYPRRILIVFTVALGTGLLWAITVGLAMLARDHTA